MKRLFILLLFAGIAANLFSQKKFVRRASLYLESDLEKTKEHLDSAVKYQENREWAKLWYTYAEYCMKVYDKNPEAIVDGKNPLVKAYECFKKTKETDDKGRYENDLKLKGQILYSKLVNMGVQGFNASDYKKALDGFEYAIKLKDMPYLKGVDTAVIYNAGLAAYNSGDYEKAEKYINRAKDLGYQLKNSFSLLNDIYMNKLNDTTKALETLKEGYEKMPENTAFLIEIIN